MCYFCVLFLTEINQEMIEDIKKACQVMNEGGVILYLSLIHISEPTRP